MAGEHDDEPTEPAPFREVLRPPFSRARLVPAKVNRELRRKQD